MAFEVVCAWIWLFFEIVKVLYIRWHGWAQSCPGPVRAELKSDLWVKIGRNLSTGERVVCRDIDSEIGPISSTPIIVHSKIKLFQPMREADFFNQPIWLAGFCSGQSERSEPRHNALPRTLVRNSMKCVIFEESEFILTKFWTGLRAIWQATDIGFLVYGVWHWNNQYYSAFGRKKARPKTNLRF